VDLCRASKQLQDQCLDFSDQQLHLIVQKALQQKQPTPDLLADVSSCYSSLAWLLGALSKRWGIMQLAARLDLQQALLAAGQDSPACYILIQAGARITRELLRASDSMMGPMAWADAYNQLSLSYPPLLHELMQALRGEALEYQQLVGLGDELLYDLFRVGLMTGRSSLTGMLISATREREWLGWSVTMVFQLMELALKQSNYHVLQHLFELPMAEDITGQQYNQLLVLLFSHLEGSWWYSTAKHIIQRVQWDDQLVEQVSAAVESQVASSFLGCRYQCGICQLLQRICSISGAALPMQLQTSLLYAATSSHKDATSTILQHLARSEGMTEAADGYNAVEAALQSWPVKPTPKYCYYFKKLLRQPACSSCPLKR
jgi:hypothetical protein